MEMVRWGTEHDVTVDSDEETESGRSGRVPVEGA